MKTVKVELSAKKQLKDKARLALGKSTVSDNAAKLDYIIALLEGGKESGTS